MDFYAITVVGPARKFAATIPGLSHSAYTRLSLLGDTNNDGVIEELVSDAHYGGTTIKVERICFPGTYYVQVWPSANTLYDLVLSRTFTNNTAPSILTQPSGITITSGKAASFVVLADGSGSLSYQWVLNGKPLPGATNPSLSLRDEISAAGSYEIAVQVTNAYGSVKSDLVTLAVISAGVELVIYPAQIISWPVEGTTGYELQGSASLAGPWLTVNRPLVRFGSRLEVAVPIENGARFFRLYKSN